MGVMRPLPAVPATAEGGRIDAADASPVSLLRRILSAAGSGDAPVGRAEAEALFDLHDAVAGGAEDAAFDELFFRAIVHHLLACGGHAVPPRGAFLAGEAPLPLPGAGTSPLRLGAEEAAWLASRIMRDGRPTRAEFALLRFFSAEGLRAGADGLECGIPSGGAIGIRSAPA